MIESEITHFADSAHRERIGNAVPRKAAKAMAEEIGRAILLSRAGESFQLSSTPIWVRPIVTALAVRGGRGVNWSEQTIGRALARQTFNRKYLVVVPNCIWTGHECDVLAVTENLRLIDVEIKISRADLKADAAKAKWWHQRYVGAPRRVEEHDERGRPIRRRNIYAREFELRTWPPKVWKHYYAMPADIWSDDLLGSLGSPASGVLLLADAGGELRIRVRRPAKPCRGAEPISPAAAVDIARLASLRMWDAYERLEQGKRHDAQAPLIRYHGGKWRLAPWIIQHLPPHRCYVEPFGGGASVLLRKPRAYAEVYNDLDDEIVNLFRVARDDGERLALACELTPFARGEFEDAYDQAAGDPLEQARRTVFRSFGLRVRRGDWAVQRLPRQQQPIGQYAGARLDELSGLPAPCDPAPARRGDRTPRRAGLHGAARQPRHTALRGSALRAFDARIPRTGPFVPSRNDRRPARRPCRRAARPAGHGGPERLPQRAVRPPLCRLDAN